MPHATDVPTTDTEVPARDLARAETDLEAARARRRVGTATAAAVALVAGGLVVGSPVPAATAGSQDRGGDVIRTWTAIAMSEVRHAKASDAQAARAYAMVDVAMFDAVNGIEGVGRHYAPAIVTPRRGVSGDPMVAAAQAAHDVLASLYDDPTTYENQLASDLARADSVTQRTKGRQWGSYVAAQVIAARTGDGILGNETQPGGSGVGVFTAAWNAQPRHLKSFAIGDPEVYVDGGPAEITSPEYADSYNEVLTVGNAKVPNQEYQDIYDYWALAGGTNQPAGAWLQVAQAVSGDLSLIGTARLFALESMALADTVATTYESKYRYHSWRPTTAVTYPGEDGNPATEPDPTFVARAGTVGGTPQHYSGHSTFSAAGAEVLAHFFCTDDVTFTLDTDDNKGLGSRTFDSFSDAAAQAGRSRVYGGQHFEFTNQASLRAGRAIADEVLATALLPADGQTGSNC